MAKISPERQPLNSKGACGKGAYSVPPSQGWEGCALQNTPLPPLPYPSPWVRGMRGAGWLGFEPQWRWKGSLSKGQELDTMSPSSVLPAGCQLAPKASP